MRIHYFSGDAAERAYVKEKLPEADIVFHEGPLSASPDLADPEADALCTFIDSKIGADVFARFPSLKLIATRSTGFDHIDLVAAKEHGVTVANVPFYGENTVAEFAFALLLALTRKVIDADERVRTGAFTQDGLQGTDLYGKTLGVVGCGHIGLHAIRMGNGFSMKVLGFDVTRNDALAKEMNFTYASLEELLASSDVITVHVPYNPHTHHLLNKDNMGKIKRGALLVNTARGAVIETDALVSAIKDGVIAGAGLDVLEEEGELNDELALLTAPHPNEATLRTTLENHFLIEHPRVIVTPHVAFNSAEAVRRILDTSIDNIAAFAKGAPQNVVKPR